MARIHQLLRLGSRPAPPPLLLLALVLCAAATPMPAGARAVEYHLNDLQALTERTAPEGDSELETIAYIRSNAERLGLAYRTVTLPPGEERGRDVPLRSIYIEVASSAAQDNPPAAPTTPDPDPPPPDTDSESDPEASDIAPTPPAPPAPRPAESLILAAPIDPQNTIGTAIMLHILENISTQYNGNAENRLQIYMLFLGSEYTTNEQNTRQYIGHGTEQFLETFGHLATDTFLYIDVLDTRHPIALDIGSGSTLTSRSLVASALQASKTARTPVSIPGFWYTALRDRRGILEPTPTTTPTTTTTATTPQSSPVTYLTAQQIESVRITSLARFSPPTAPAPTTPPARAPISATDANIQYYHYAQYIQGLVASAAANAAAPETPVIDTNYLLFPVIARYAIVSETVIIIIILSILALVYTLVIFRRDFIRQTYLGLLYRNFPLFVAHLLLLVITGMLSAYTVTMILRIESPAALWREFPLVITLLRFLLWHLLHLLASALLIKTFPAPPGRAYSAFALLACSIALFPMLAYDLLYAISMLAISLGALAIITSHHRAHKRILFISVSAAFALLFIYVSLFTDAIFFQRLLSSRFVSNLFIALLILPLLFIHHRLTALRASILATARRGSGAGWPVSVTTFTLMLLCFSLFYTPIRAALIP